jgi:hypothetical protein
VATWLANGRRKSMSASLQPVPAPPPRPAYARPLAEIIADLSKPLPSPYLKVKVLKGQKITFISWQTAVRALDHYAPGWSSEVRSVAQLGTRAVVVVRLTIPCAEGFVWREAIGQEDEWDDAEEKRYGDPTSNAEAMALKRAAAKFGLALYLYDGK